MSPPAPHPPRTFARDGGAGSPGKVRIGKHMATKMNQYEAMFLMATNHTSDVDGSIKLVRATIEKHHGEVLVAKKWDERKLAYEIGKAKRGLYIIAYFKAPGADITPMERDVKLSEDYIRVLVTKADHLSMKEMESVEPQPIAPPQPERAPWDAPSAMDFSGPSGGGGDRGPRGPRTGGKRRDDAEVEVGKD